MVTINTRKLAAVPGCFDALVAGKDKILVGSFPSKTTGVANEILPEPPKAKVHAKQAAPGSGGNGGKP